MSLSVAIVGGGPSAFYVATRILHLLSSEKFRVHIYDRLWAPHGLVRYGVAPDHPEVKNCTHKFDTTCADPRVRFFGNINVSMTSQVNTLRYTESAPLHAHTIPLQALMPHYTHLVFATGAPRPRLHPLLPRSSVCIPALDIVHWYTMHPSSPYSPHLTPARVPTTPIIPPNTRHITLIGHGNVSLDVARILLTSPARLSTLDIPEHALRTLHDTWRTLRHVSIVGRRGPREVRFTAKEVREMMGLPDARMLDAEVPAECWTEEGLSRQQVRVMKLLREGSKHGDRASWTGKTFSIDYWRSPTGYTFPHSVAPSSPDTRVALHLEETRVDSATGRAIGTGRRESIHTDLIVTSLGYEGDGTFFGNVNDNSGADAIPPAGGRPARLARHSQAMVPWYDPSAGHIRTEPGGRVLTPEGRVVPNVYAAGWAAHGARGVLAGTLLDANDVARTLVEDWSNDGSAGQAEMCEGDKLGCLPPAVEVALREGKVVEYEAWRRVEEEERRRGNGIKERERMGWGDVLHFLGR